MFSVPGRPASKPNGYRIVTRTDNLGRERQSLARSRRVAEWETLVGWHARIAMRHRPPMDGWLRVEIVVRTTSFASVADRDNVPKSVRDAMQGIVYHDDAQVVGGGCEWEPPAPHGEDAILVSVQEATAWAGVKPPAARRGRGAPSKAAAPGSPSRPTRAARAPSA